MPKAHKKTETVWECSGCKTEYVLKSAACDCEEDHKLAEIMDEKEKVFPSKHAKDDRFREHCVNCGTLLKAWQTSYDNDQDFRLQIKVRGDLRFDSECFHIYQGMYCKSCYADLTAFLIMAVKKARKKKPNG